MPTKKWNRFPDQSKKYIWKCPKKGCPAQGTKRMTRSRAYRFGRLHLKHRHNDLTSEPIVVQANAKKFTIEIITEIDVSKKEIEGALSDLNYVAEIIKEESVNV